MSDWMAVLIGVLCGIAAGIPFSLLVIWLQVRQWRAVTTQTPLLEVRHWRAVTTPLLEADNGSVE